MINLRKLIAIARKWQKMAGIDKRRISPPTRITNKGHFVVYSSDEKRFVIPLEYLSSGIFKELLKLSEEEFGLPRDGPIKFPCDAACLEYIVSVVQRQSSEELEEALIASFSLSNSQHALTAPVSEGLPCHAVTVEGLIYEEPLSVPCGNCSFFVLCKFFKGKNNCRGLLPFLSVLSE